MRMVRQKGRGPLDRLPGRKGQFRTALAFSMAGGALLVAEAWLMARIVNEAFLGEGDWPSLLFPLGLLLAAAVLRGLVHAAGESAALGRALAMKAELRRAAAEKLAVLGPQFAKGERSGELIHAVTDGLDRLEQYVARYVPQLAQSMFIPLAVLTAVLGADWFSAIILAATMPLLILFMILVGKTAGWKAKKQYKLLGRLSGHLFDVIRGLYTLTIFNRSKEQIAVIARMSDAHRRATMGTLRLAFLSAFVMELFATLSTAVVAVFLGLRLIDGGIGFLAAFFVLLLTPEFYQPVRALGAQFHASQDGVAAAARIFELLDAELPGIPEREDGIRLPERPEGYRIVFDRVTVRHPGADRPALEDVSLVLEPGERVAIVGKSGAGKTTLLELIQGFIRPTEGRITVDGVDLADLSMAWWRGQLAVLAQDVRLFPGSVRDNLLMAKPDAAEGELWAALEDARVADVVRRLPGGLDAPLGEAVRLSGGQIQRIGLARAFLKGAPVHLLDEPTSGLDRLTEDALGRAMQTRLAGRQTVTVAHKLETIQAADRIIALADGRIREIGSPRELLARGGLYADLVRAGAARGGAGAGHAAAHAAPATAVRGASAPSVHAAPAAAVRDASASSEHAAPAMAGKVLASVVAAGRSSGTGSRAVRLVRNEADRPVGSQSVFPVGSEPRDPVAGRSAERSAAPGAVSGKAVMRLFLGFLRPFKGRMLLALLLGSLTVAASVGLMATSGYLISKAALRPETVLLLWIPIVGVRFFGISRGVFRYLERLVSHDLTFRILHRIRVWIYERVEPRGALLLEQERSGDILDAMIRDVEKLQNLYLRVLAPPLVAVVITVLGFSIAAGHHPLLGLTLAAMMALAGAGIPLAGRLLGRRTGERYILAKAGLSTGWSDLIGGLAELTIFGRSGEALKRLAELGTRADREQALQNRIHAWLGGAMVFLMRLSAWLMLALSVRLAGDGAIEPVFIASLVVMTLACFEAVIPLPEAFQNYGQTAAAARRLVRLTEQTAAQPGNGQTAARTEFESGMASETAGGAIRRRTVPGLAGGPVLEVRNLSYRYHPDEPRALRDLSLTLRPGRKIAIVGESGAGKSTFLHLLLRLRPFEEGQILLDGTDIRTMSPERVREHFAVVSQRVQLFNATVEDNLRIAKPDATLEEMREAARLAMIDDVIMGMPDGYRTVIGEWGARLSGGERQRLALARALLRDAPFVLFDEPATGLDPLTERSVRHNLDHRLKDKGILWITHKLAGLDRMDEIIVLGNGAVTERGTHAELVATGGGYARMWWLERQFGT